MGVPGVSLRLLGPISLEIDGNPQQLGGPRQRAVLAALALEPQRTIAVDRIIVDLWDDDARRQPRNNVQVYVSNLRRILRPCADRLWIAGEGGGYRLDAAPGVIDHQVFQHEMEDSRRQAERGLSAAAARAAARALAMWRGPFLSDLASQFDVFTAAAERAEEERLHATEHWLSVELDAGRSGELVAELEALTGAHPMRERFWLQLMTALARAGRQRDALQAFQRARAVMAEEAGLEPGKELRALEAALLGGEELPSTGPMDGVHLAYIDAAGALVRVPLVAGGAYTIGRDPAADISIAWDARASRLHARLWHEHGAWHVHDCGSTNGTLVNGSRVDGDVVVRVDDVLVAGSTAMSLRDASQPRALSFSPSEVTIIAPRKHDHAG